MSTHVEKGKTVEEAIEKALNKLAAKPDEVEIEVLQKPSTKFFGLKSEPAVVQVTRKRKTAVRSSAAGALSVVEGKLQYAPPTQGGVEATLSFGSEFHVSYHGEPVLNQVRLPEGLEPLIVVLPQDREPELHYEIRVNKDKTAAELFWKRNPGVLYSLGDQAPSNHLQLALGKTMLEAPKLSVEEVRQLAVIEGLKHGLRLEQLTEAMLEAPQGLFTIAVGVAPAPGRPATISYVFKERGAEIDLEAIRIDYYEAHGIQGVQEGDVLAVKTPRQMGTVGIDVYGEEIPVDTPADPQIMVGEGVSLSADGLQAIASTAGLPALQNGVLKVTKVFELPGDADVSTGNITMDSDIIIRGNVLENVKVESYKGAIVVNGLVSGAVLRTGGPITVLRNVVRSQLFAGGATVSQIRLLSMLQQIGDGLEKLITAYEAIVQQAENIPFENLIKHLLELKFFSLPTQIKELEAYMEELSKSTLEDATLLRDAFSGSVTGIDLYKIGQIEQLREFYTNVRGSVFQLEDLGSSESDITVGYLQNSRVEASGQVEITGQGCFYSQVLAGRGFKIANGVFRGGEVVVNSGQVLAKELGGPTGISTQIELIKEGRITAGRMHPNVQVVLGNQSYKFDDVTNQVKVHLENGVLTVYTGSLKIHG